MSLLEDTKLLLKKHGVRPSRKLGQNFLVDSSVLEREISYADVRQADTVLEVGPGVGNLTELLARHAGKVYAVETDTRMVEILRERLGRRVEIIEGDFLKVKLPAFDKAVSNIPYSISSPLTFRLLSHGFRSAVLTYQKEFAERMVAKPGERSYSRLSVATYYYAEVEMLEVLPPEAFYPQPEVDSAIVRLTPKGRPFEVNEERFFALVRGLFSHRKKTLKKALFFALSDAFGIDDKGKRREIAATIEGELAERRVFTLAPEELAGICGALEETL